MNETVLVDTGFLVALFRRDDPYGESARKFMAGPVRERRLRLVTVWPVIVESCFFFHTTNRPTYLRWVAEGGVAVRQMTVTDLPVVAGLLERYGDREMDFADACLVWLAGIEGTNRVLTTDFLTNAGLDGFENHRRGHLAGTRQGLVQRGLLDNHPVHREESRIDDQHPAVRQQVRVIERVHQVQVRAQGLGYHLDRLDPDLALSRDLVGAGQLIGQGAAAGLVPVLTDGQAGHQGVDIGSAQRQ